VNIENEPESCPPNEEALFRYALVSAVLARELRGESRAEAVHAVAASDLAASNGQLRRAGARTLYRWTAAYESGGFAALEPAPRPRKDDSRALPDGLLNFARAEKKRDPAASLPELIRRARESGIVSRGEKIDRVTLWRACQRRGVPTSRRKRLKHRDVRRFAYPNRMQMVLCDGKHFRAGSSRVKRVALFFLDDATRLALGVAVGPAESAALFLRGLFETIHAYGFMNAIFLDRGAGFIANDCAATARSSLGILLIHGEKAYPEGRGKIERFNQTAGAGLLRGFDLNPEIDPAFSALELRIWHYLGSGYNRQPHESLDGASPAARFGADERPLRFPASADALRQQFVVYEKRRVSNDNVVNVNGSAYEMPPGYAGSRVCLQIHLLDGAVRFQHQGRMAKLSPPDLAGNAMDRRAGNAIESGPEVHPLPKSAADMAFERDFRPAVGADGGVPDGPPNPSRPS
jgi:putative transposase